MKKSWNMTFVSYNLFPEPVLIMVKFKKKYQNRSISQIHLYLLQLKKLLDQMMIAVQHEYLKTLQFNAKMMTVLQCFSVAVLQFCTSARHSKSQKNNFSSRDSESCEQAGNAENDLYQMYRSYAKNILTSIFWFASNMKQQAAAFGQNEREVLCCVRDMKEGGYLGVSYGALLGISVSRSGSHETI